jgi:hypothetical protein
MKQNREVSIGEICSIVLIGLLLFTIWGAAIPAKLHASETRVRLPVIAITMTEQHEGYNSTVNYYCLWRYDITLLSSNYLNELFIDNEAGTYSEECEILRMGSTNYLFFKQPEGWYKMIGEVRV